jgi:UDP-glucuronate 4-epimerase
MLGSEESLTRIGVTGAAGFIGSHLVERLIAEGHEVVGVDCFSANYPRELKERNLAGLAAEPRFSLIEGDMCAPPAAHALRRCTTVVHLAALPGVRTGDHEQLWCVNAQGTERLLEGLVGGSVRRLILGSSSSVYGSCAAPRHEHGPVRPRSEYARSKLAAERLCFSSGLSAVVLRYFTVYGPRQRPDMAFATFIEAALGGTAAPLFAARDGVRHVTFVADAVDATVRALERASSGAIYNVAGPRPATVARALRTIERYLGRPVPVRELPPHPADALHTRAATVRARRDLGWTARTGLAEGLRAQVDDAVTEHGRVVTQRSLDPASALSRRSIGS